MCLLPSVKIARLYQGWAGLRKKSGQVSANQAHPWFSNTKFITKYSIDNHLTTILIAPIFNMPNLIKKYKQPPNYYFNRPHF